MKLQQNSNLKLQQSRIPVYMEVNEVLIKEKFNPTFRCDALWIQMVIFGHMFFMYHLTTLVKPVPPRNPSTDKRRQETTPWYNNHHRFEWHHLGKRDGYNNLIHNEISYDINGIEILKIADSGTTGHYFISTTPCVDKKISLNPLPIHIPNGEINYSTHTALLRDQDLPLEARRCHILPGLNMALAYIGVLCDHECISCFDKNKVTITNKMRDRVLMQVGRYTETGLYILEMPTTSI